MVKRLYFLALAIAVAMVGCIDPPEYPLTPEIEFVSQSKDTITEQVDSFSVVFSFTDGDGDLGFSPNEIEVPGACFDTIPVPNPSPGQDSFRVEFNGCDSACYNNDRTSLIVIDQRTGCSVSYNLPDIPPKGSSRAISGKVTITFSNILCFPDGGVVGQNPDFDSLRYEIRLRDRSGNVSNPIVTPVVILDCLN